MCSGLKSLASSNMIPMAYGVNHKLLTYIAPDHKETDINCVSVSKEGKMLAVGDKLGKLKIFCYPAHLEKQKFKAIEGHPNNVKCLEFLQDDNYLISVGEQDCSVLIWSYKLHEGEVRVSTSHSISIPVTT